MVKTILNKSINEVIVIVKSCRVCHEIWCLFDSLAEWYCVFTVFCQILNQLLIIFKFFNSRNGKEMIWEHFASVLRRDSKRAVPITKLSAESVYLNNFSKMRVNLAVHTLNPIVAQVFGCSITN
jgi:hypothetical protein